MGEHTTDCKNIKKARYGILTEALMKFLFFLVSWYWRFGGACYLYYQSNPGTLLHSFWTTLRMDTSNFSETLFLHTTSNSIVSQYLESSNINCIHSCHCRASWKCIARTAVYCSRKLCFSQKGSDVPTAFVSFTLNPSCSISVWSR